MEIVFTKQAVKDFEKVKSYPVLLKKVRALLELIEINPFLHIQEESMCSIDWFTKFMKKRKLLKLFVCGHIMNSVITVIFAVGTLNFEICDEKTNF